jgi:NAD(P)-dependent dehydrogenase (short-subunit alcohol dehydrogenase family)
MKTRTFGRTGWQVSEIGFGAWGIGGGQWGGADDTESMAALHKALDCGINFFDTADVYGDGLSERLIARLRRERKEPFYVATKAGVIGMTQVWARELGKRNITVNAVAPGFIATEMTAKMPAAALDAMRSHTPAGRVGSPDDVANAYCFLASDLAAFINGAVLAVDGGLVIGT